MSQLNTEWAIGQLTDFIRATDPRIVKGGYLKYQTALTVLYREQFLGQTPLSTQVLAGTPASPFRRLIH